MAWQHCICVHESGRVEFVPDRNRLEVFRLGENQNRNWPILMVGSSGSGLSVSGRLSVGFGFWSQCRYFVAGSIKIWPIFGRTHQLWTRSRRDLARSGGFHATLCQKIKNIAGSGGLQWISRSSLSENLWISSDFIDFMVGSGGSDFWGVNPPAHSKGSGLVGGNSLETIGLIGSGGGRSVLGESGGLSRSPGCLDTPDNWHPIGTLSLEFGYSVIYAASKPEAKVVCFDFWLLKDKVWIWKLATSIFMVRFRKSMTLWKIME